ncbi:cbp/p300-interacting transactivator 4-like [Serinus canaria]|uniref:cbp/p300-interacting transactivator 4-like n=1 Tax=Serinus canaria TaxID=9135 RepID=UPI0021CCEF28|nr:cbp/p300-interacting transactivator 4-like [Serinus canaria]
MVLPSGGWGLLGDPCTLRRPPHTLPGLGLGLQPGRAPPPPPYKALRESPAEPAGAKRCPRHFVSPNPASAPLTRGNPPCAALGGLRLSSASPSQPAGAPRAPPEPREPPHCRGRGQARPERRGGPDASVRWVYESGWMESSLTRTFDLNLPPFKELPLSLLSAKESVCSGQPRSFREPGPAHRAGEGLRSR